MQTKSFTEVGPHSRPVDGIYSISTDYVHAVEMIDARRILFIAGTMGLRVDGTAGDGISEQLHLIWGNIRRILAEADMTVDDIVRLTTYLTNRSLAAANATARVEALSGRSIPTTAIIVQTLDPSWLVEIEVVAAG